MLLALYFPEEEIPPERNESKTYHYMAGKSDNET